MAAKGDHNIYDPLAVQIAARGDRNIDDPPRGDANIYYLSQYKWT